MPKEKKEKVECELCGKKFKNLAGLAGHKRFAHGSQPIENETEALQTIQEIESSPISPESQEKLDLLKLQLQNKTESQKLSDSAEKEIQAKSQARRSMKEDLDIMKIEEELAKRQPSSQDDIDKMLTRRERVALIKSLENPQQSQSSTDHQLQSERERYDFQLKMMEKFQELKDEKKDIVQTMSEFKTFTDVAEQHAKKSGWIKSAGDESPWAYIGNALTDLLPKLIDFGKESLAQKSQQQEQFFKNHGAQTPAPGEILPGENNQSENNVSHESFEQEQAPPSPAPVTQQMPSDAALLADNSLRDPYRPVQDYPSLDYAQNLYLSAQSPQIPPTSTTPQF